MLNRVARITFLALSVMLVMSSVGCAPLDRDLFTAGKVMTVKPSAYGIGYEEYRFSTRDGKLLTGWMLAGNPELPALLFFHGNGTNISGSMEYLRIFNRIGFRIFIFDYRGFGESTGEVVSENDLYEDARAALRYLEQKGWRHEKIIYYGQSLGAAMAIQLALEAPPAGLVVESSFTSYPDMATLMAPVAYRIFGWCCKIDGFDNLAKIADIHVPLLIIHGDSDTLIPIDMSRRLFNRAHEPKTFHVIRGGGHCDAAAFGGEAYLEAWRGFLASISQGGP
jgi:pimeloyl-ACP methyl ester carboxylesterase